MYYGQQNQQSSYYPYQYMTQQNRYIPPEQPLMQYSTAQTQTPAMSFLKGRLVTSVDEVRAAQIDFDGSLFIFPDVANNCIYTKQISASGSALLNKYVLQEDSTPPAPNYVTKEEFDTIVNQLQSAIESKNTIIEQLKAVAETQNIPKPIKTDTISEPIKTKF